MGVRFLETYLEKTSPSACYEVNIADLVRKYRVETGLDPVVVLDGLSCIHPLYGKLNWLTGGQFKEALVQFNKFIENFLELGCKLVVFFDGPTQKVKIPVWMKRRLTEAERLSNVFSCLYMGTSYVESVNQYITLPSNMKTVFLYAVKQHNCKVITATRECDDEIAEYAFQNNCFAILGQDTDFVIYQAARYYLSMKNLNVERMTTLCYDSNKLAVDLGFDVSRLPLFASLSGNDIIAFDSLKNFHYFLKRNTYERNIVILVANFVKSLKTIDLSSIARTVFGQSSKAAILQESISSYKLKKNYHSKEEGDPNEKWQKIKNLIKMESINSLNTPIYDIMILNQYTTSSSLEDYNPSKIIRAVGNVTKDLRRSIYGILLFEKPLDKGKERHIVSELVMTGINSMDDFIQVQPKYLEKVKHPGLEALWTSKEKEIQNVRWQILGEVFSLEASSLSQLPPYYLVPVLAARYFKNQYNEIKEWEVDALISCSVCVRHYKPEELANLPKDPLTYRQIWIYTTISKIYYTIGQLLIICGNPVPFQYTVSHEYTDGKLFHEKYRQASKQAPVEKLCENKRDNMKIYDLLKSLILE